MTQKKYATISNPSINAVLKSLFRFASEAQALDRIQQLKDHFVTSKQSESPKTAIIWVRGYALTEDEIGQVFTGNFAAISIKKTAEKFTLNATKIPPELRLHPQRKRPQKSHPDWGHPILRQVKKKRIFNTIEEASNELNRLHAEFPEISIPDETRLLIIIYEKLEGIKSPVQKYKFEIKPLSEGGFFIDYKRNSPAVKLPPSDKISPNENGYFSTMIKLKKRKRLPKPEA